MYDNILLFSSKWDIIHSIRMIDSSKEKLQNPDLYYLIDLLLCGFVMHNS